MDSLQQPHCAFVVTRKKRFCRMTVRPGHAYCPEHEPRTPTPSQDDARVPCPLDSKHTCYASKLQRHLEVCNAREGPSPAHIERGVNAGGAPLRSRAPLARAPPHALAGALSKVDGLYRLVLEGGISTWDDGDAVHAAVADELRSASRTESSRRHLRQVSSLMRLAEREGLVGERTCYAELGAGRGQLAYYLGVAWCAPNTGSSVLLVDRAAPRYKRDNKLQDARATRLRADLADLLLARVPAVREATRLVALAKHLCGAAADYALRCVARERRARGVLLATCCHHRCDGGSYVGASRLRELGVTADELELVLGAVSWATCGSGLSRSAPADERLRSQEGARERAEAGRRAKAVLDWGRAEYLRAHGWDVRLVRFVPESVSPENLCLVATRREPEPEPAPAASAS